MRNIQTLLLLLSISLVLPFGQLSAQNGENLPYLDQLPPLIDREIFFDDPEIASAQISPDGNFISFRRPLDGVMNVWVKEIDEPFDNARPVTAETEQPIPGYFWSRNSEYILYVNDEGGDENFNVYAVDPGAEPEGENNVPPSRNLTDLKDVRAQIYSVPRNEPEYIVVGLNDRDQRYHDVYRVHIESGEKELLIENEHNISGWNVDDDGNVRFASRETESGGTEILEVTDDTLEKVYEVSFEESAGITRFHEDGERVYMVTNKGDDVDLSRLILFNPETGEETLIEDDPEGEVDFGGALFSEVEDKLLATYYNGDKRRIYFHDDQFEEDYEFLRSELPDGNIGFVSRTEDEQQWLVSISSDVNPGAVYLFDRDSEEVTFQYQPRPDLPTEHLAEMQPIRYTARDGLEIPAYLTIPKGVEPENLAVIVLPHGGPWARDSWGYDSQAQFLANRGYAVLQPNFRGSTGYGKEFLNAGNKEWGTGSMQHDISDGVQYLIDEGIADPDLVGIYGISYGGYATLAGLAFTPDLYAAGVSYVGPSNIITLLESIPPYWEPIINMFHRRVGNPEDPEDQELLKEQSPLNSAEQIEDPLMVVQGANDPRVAKHESDQIVVAMRELGHDVEYIVAPDEGHGFRKPENRISFYVALEQFFAEHLGGRYQEEVPDEISEHLENITVDISGVELQEPAEGLEEAATAPLPEFNISRLSQKESGYHSVIETQGQQFEVNSTRTIEKTERDGEDVWQVAETSSSPMGTSSDTTYLEYESLKPISRSISQQGAQINIEYSDSHISGNINAQGQQRTIDVETEAPVLSDGGGLDLAMLALPLSEGYETTFRIFSTMQQNVQIHQLEVTGRENIEIPAGSYDAFKVEVRAVENGNTERTLWISDEDSPRILKSIDELPAAMGGGQVSTELENEEVE